MNSIDFGLFDFGCMAEGLYAYVFFLVELTWNLLWLYDYVYILKHPLSYSEKYLYFYAVVAYFIGFLLGIISFFQSLGHFSPVSFSCQ